MIPSGARRVASFLQRAPLVTVLLAVGGLGAGAHAAPLATASDPRQAIGLYAVPASACSLVAASGFTIIHSYDFELETSADATRYVQRARAYLDNAHHWGLRVLLGLPREWLHDGRKTLIRDSVRTLRDHPALLAWYEDERAEEGDLDAVLLAATVVAAEDPVHGFVIEEGKTDNALLAVGRVRMFTYYPVSRDSRRSPRLKTCSERFPVDGLKVPFWPVLQAFGVDLIRGPARHDLLSPTHPELEATLCSALVAGARGVFFYPYLHATTYDAHRGPNGSYGDYRPLPEIAPALWGAVRDCAGLASRLFDLLAGAQPSQTLRIARAPRGVEVGRWDTANGTLVIVANLATTASQLELSCKTPAGKLDWITAPEHGVVRDGDRLTLLVPPTSGMAFVIETAKH